MPLEHADCEVAMTPFGPIPGMPGGPPWGSVEAINAMAWHLNQQAAAAYAQQQAPPIRELSPEERARLAREAAERERARKEEQERMEAERRAHDARVAAREERVGWPAARIRVEEIERRLERYAGRPEAESAIGELVWLIIWFGVAVEGAMYSKQPWFLLAALPGLLAIPRIWEWRRARKIDKLSAELTELLALRGCGDSTCPRCSA